MTGYVAKATWQQQRETLLELSYSTKIQTFEGLAQRCKYVFLAEGRRTDAGSG